MEILDIGQKIVGVSPIIGQKWKIGKRKIMMVDLRGTNQSAIFVEKLDTSSTTVPR